MSYNFRVDTCGSYLRPPQVLEARYKHSKNEITADQLFQIESKHIKDVVGLQIQKGLKIVTDGELRRNDFASDFLVAWNGVERNAPITEEKDWNTGEGLGKFNSFRFPVTVGKISANPNHPELAHFDYLRSIVPEGITPKVLIPTPTFFFSGRGIHDPAPAPYTSLEEWYQDIAKAYRDTILQFYEHKARVIQLDEPSILTAPAVFHKDDEKGQYEQFHHLKDVSFKILSIALKDLPSDLNILLHLCRGNNREFTKQLNRPKPGYNDCIEFITGVNPVASLLEYDDERSGSFEPLKKVHELKPNMIISLGVVTTKTGKLESDELIEKRVHEAAKYVPLDKLAICNQCGFGTLKEGNDISEADQWAKVDLLVRVAKKIWGSA